jgi:hypothetical protein
MLAFIQYIIRYWRVPNLILARYMLITLVLIHVRLPL